MSDGFSFANLRVTIGVNKQLKSVVHCVGSDGMVPWSRGFSIVPSESPQFRGWGESQCPPCCGWFLPLFKYGVDGRMVNFDFL